MARDEIYLEPAERDPARLRRTGWTIAILMMVGGVVIASAYLIKLRGEEKEDRPPVLGRLQKIFGGRDQHNKVFETTQLEGKLTLFTPVKGSESERMSETLRAMKLVAEKYPDEESFRFVGVTIDPENDGPEELQRMLEDLGVGDDPRWFFVQAEEENARKYLKKELRLDTQEVIRVDGEKVKRFLSLLAVVDQHLHLRQHYNFNQAREVQDDARRLLEEDPEEAKRQRAEDHRDDVQAAEQHLLRTLEIIRSEKLEGGKPS